MTTDKNHQIASPIQLLKNELRKLERRDSVLQDTAEQFKERWRLTTIRIRQYKNAIRKLQSK